MRVTLTGRDVEISPSIRKLVDRKLAKLDRQTESAVVSAQVVLEQERHRRLAEITLHARGDHVAHGLGDTTAWESSLAEAVDKVARQLRRVKGKWAARKRSGATTTPGRRAVRRSRRYAVKPMTVDEAAFAMDVAEDSFLVFRNTETDEVNVVYRRPDGGVGLIEPGR